MNDLPTDFGPTATSGDYGTTLLFIAMLFLAFLAAFPHLKTIWLPFFLLIAFFSFLTWSASGSGYEDGFLMFGMLVFAFILYMCYRRSYMFWTLVAFFIVVLFLYAGL